jgi:uncharacterized protein YbaR (Trm112 family)
MARKDASELLNALGPSLRAAAKNVLHHAYGPDGMPWGTRFADAEDLAAQVGDLLAREILQAALQGQADQPRPDDLSACPSCSGPLQGRPPQLRTVFSKRGDVAWEEPTLYCPRCRRAFFPSVQEPGP